MFIGRVETCLLAVCSLGLLADDSTGAGPVPAETGERTLEIIRRVREGYAANWSPSQVALVVEGSWQHDQDALIETARGPSRDPAGGTEEHTIPSFKDTYQLTYYRLGEEYERVDRVLSETDMQQEAPGSVIRMATNGEETLKYDGRLNASIDTADDWQKGPPREGFLLLRRPVWKRGFYTVEEAMNTCEQWLAGNEYDLTVTASEVTRDGRTLYLVHVEGGKPGWMRVDMWFDPQHGHSPVETDAEGSSFHYKMKVDRWELIGDTWLPAEGQTDASHGGLSVVKTHFKATSIHLDDSIDPEFFTLEGLGAKAGTVVVDWRLDQEYVLNQAAVSDEVLQALLKAPTGSKVDVSTGEIKTAVAQRTSADETGPDDAAAPAIPTAPLGAFADTGGRSDNKTPGLLVAGVALTGLLLGGLIAGWLTRKRGGTAKDAA